MNIFAKLLVALVLVASCKKADQTDMKPVRLFRPVSFAAAVDGVSVNFTWIPIKDASYSLEISKDSLRFENELQVIPIDKTSSYTIDGLSGNTRYSARIKSISSDPATADSEYTTLTFVTQADE